MGITQYLSLPNVISHLRDNQGQPLHQLSGRRVEEPHEAVYRYGLPSAGASTRGRGRERFSLAGVWVHPYQTLLPSLEEVAKNLLYLSAQRRIGTLPLCELMRICSTSPFLMPDTSAS